MEFTIMLKSEYGTNAAKAWSVKLDGNFLMGFDDYFDACDFVERLHGSLTAHNIVNATSEAIAVKIKSE